jgi:hypothetical protein
VRTLDHEVRIEQLERKLSRLVRYAEWLTERVAELEADAVRHDKNGMRKGAVAK